MGARMIFFGSMLLLLANLVQAQQLDASLDLARFRISDSTGILEIYTTVGGNSVKYKKSGKTSFQASVAMEVQLSDSAGVRYFDNLVLKSPVVHDTAVSKLPFSFQKRILVRNGTYTLRCRMKDLNASNDFTVVEVPLRMGFSGEKVQISDIQMLESFKKTQEQNDYTKNGYQLISYVSNFYPKEVKRLKWYAEIYNLAKVAGEGEPVVIFYRIEPESGRVGDESGSFSRQKAAPVNVLLAELDISSLGSGNYYLAIEVKDRNNKTLAVQREFFQRSNPGAVAKQEHETLDLTVKNTFADQIDSLKIPEYLLYLIPVANKAEAASLASLAASGNAMQQRAYLYHFWKKRSDTDAEYQWKDYLSRILYVDQHFSNQTFKGYQNDRGRVYLQYGPPNQVMTERTDPQRPVNNSDTRPYQIWQYYKTQTQSNRIFVFMQQNLGNNNYRLIHSNANGEISNPEWRKEVGQRFSGNPNFDRNSGTRNDF